MYFHIITIQHQNSSVAINGSEKSESSSIEVLLLTFGLACEQFSKAS